MLRTAQAIVRDQGTTALWRGNLTNCARYFPTQAINFACKERYQKLLVPDRANGFAPGVPGVFGGGRGRGCHLPDSGLPARVRLYALSRGRRRE